MVLLIIKEWGIYSYGGEMANNFFLSAEKKFSAIDSVNFAAITEYNDPTNALVYNKTLI
jgi:hypothetical protein